MNQHTIQRRIMNAFLPDIPFDGWVWDGIVRAGNKAGYDDDIIHAAFPDGVIDAVDAFSRMMDDGMMEQLSSKSNNEQTGIRRSIHQAVMARFDALNPYREVERLAVGICAHPKYARRALKMVWRTADRIWDNAGDVSTDYNRYTKRGLLSAVLIKGTLYWLADESNGYTNTSQFIQRQFDLNVKTGQKLARFRGPLKRVWGMRPFSKEI